jgi:hypothetical protein
MDIEWPKERCAGGGWYRQQTRETCLRQHGAVSPAAGTTAWFVRPCMTRCQHVLPQLSELLEVYRRVHKA